MSQATTISSTAMPGGDMDGNTEVHIMTGTLLSVLALLGIDRRDRHVDGFGRVNIYLPERTKVRVNADGEQLEEVHGVPCFAAGVSQKHPGLTATPAPCAFDTVEVSIRCGCHCSRDCCGHQCGHRFMITKMEDFWVVKESRSYNY